jgi:hypothetical protein
MGGEKRGDIPSIWLSRRGCRSGLVSRRRRLRARNGEGGCGFRRRRGSVGGGKGAERRPIGGGWWERGWGWCRWTGRGKGAGAGRGLRPPGRTRRGAGRGQRGGRPRAEGWWGEREALGLAWPCARELGDKRECQARRVTRDQFARTLGGGAEWAGDCGECARGARLGLDRAYIASNTPRLDDKPRLVCLRISTANPRTLPPLLFSHTRCLP